MESNQHNGIQPADRLSLVSEYYFSRKLKEVARLNAEGKDIISLAIGSPDMLRVGVSFGLLVKNKIQLTDK